ncbi:MAG: hydroxymethylglutaryl-CoA reductase, degradative [Rhodobacterales bacterium]|nr:hydroxymethylglutaryl-CoA reductase, degradative [Rhodobacterales bacterium]
MSTNSSNIKNMRNLSPQQRLEAVSKAINCDQDLLNDLKGEGSLPLKIADGMIENVVGRFELPLGIATNFLVNGKDYLIPMAVEEPSVVAAASHMAKLARTSGGFQAVSDRPIMLGQIQVMDLEDLYASKTKILEYKNELILAANEKDKILVNLGGGCEDLEVHLFNETPAGPMLVVHLLVDVCDAMGANTVNTMAEHIAPLIEKLINGRVRLRILSNLADKRLVTASVKLSASQFDTKNYSGNEVIKGIFEAASFATVDPYRAATHNKGIMNGIDPIVVVTGNDWRAIEAGAHAFAARDGHYTSLTDWSISNNGDLLGKITLPMAVGLVGGATKTHPTAKAAIALLGVKTATELGQVIAAVGLAQNLAALRALATEGIQRGHMTLHARNIAVQAGANGSEIDLIVKGMIDSQNVTTDNAMQILKGLR